MQPIALYVHIPFCETKCPYCDFNTYAKIESLIPGYVTALETEIETWGTLLGGPAVRTIFFGGGTPSYLPSDDIASLITAISASFEIEDGAEVTLEANPGDFVDGKLAEYLNSGINRLSIGVQSFDDELLELLGRRHSVAEAVAAYKMAQDAGFDNVSIDLMYGLPHQTVDHWKTTLDRATDLHPTHISMYALTLEGGTPMEHSVEVGKLPSPDPDLAADMYAMAEEAFDDLGYRHYEISNWAVEGRESRHNLVYWHNEPYLGVGPGAHSYLHNHRFANLKPPREYVRRLSSAQHPHSNSSPSRGRGQETAGEGRREGFTHSPLESDSWDGGNAATTIRSVPVVDSVEFIDKRLEMAETMMLGLRRDEGISLHTFENRFAESPLTVYKNVFDDLAPTELIEVTNDHIRLTPKGLFLSNEVFIRFFD